MMVAIPEQGRLAEVPFPHLLLNLYKARFSGAVTLSRERVGKRFLLDQGVPVFAESNLASESLGVQLMDAGRITRSDYSRVVGHIDKHQCKEGTALLKLGLLEPKDLFHALKNQIRIRLIECFGWPQGEFQIDPTAEPSADAQPFRGNVLAVLQEGIETHWSSDRILDDLSANMERFPLRTQRFEKVADQLHQDTAVTSLLESLDGTRSFWKVLQTANTPRALAAAWVLAATDALEFRDEAVSVDADQEQLDPDLEIVIGSDSTRQATQHPTRRIREQMGATRKHRMLAIAIKREIEAKHEHLGELNAYELLDVLPEADDRTLRKAYLQAAKRYHPDALSRLGFADDLRERANRVFAEIGKAHNILSDRKQRKRYDAALLSNDTDFDANRLAQAEKLYRKGEVLLRQGNFSGALEFLRPAVDLWPEEAAYQSALGWVLHKKLPSEPERAREHLELAKRLDPHDSEINVRLGIVLRDSGDANADSA